MAIDKKITFKDLSGALKTAVVLTWITGAFIILDILIAVITFMIKVAK